MERNARRSDKRSREVFDEDSPVPSGADASRSMQTHNESNAANESIPGFFYDAARKRYFRTGHGAPENNFTVPVSQLVPKRTRPRYPWIHPEIVNCTSKVNLLTSWELALPGEPSYRSRRSTVGAYNHANLAKIGSTPAMYKWAATQSNQSSVQYSPFFHTVDVLLNAEHPRAFFVAHSSGQRTTGVPAGNGAEFRTANFEWKNNELLASDFRVLKAGSLLPAELCTIHSVALFPPGRAFFSCVAASGTYRIGLCISETATGIHSMPVITSHDIVAADKTQARVATGSRESSEIRLFSLDNMQFSSVVVTDDEHAEVFCCSLDFTTSHPDVLLVGTNRGSVVQVDHRQDRCTSIISADVWKEIGITGKCTVKNIKACNTQNRFITNIAGLPLESPKMHLWDERYAKSPLSFFEETTFSFSRESFPISLSSDDTLAVCSDAEGTARLWDVNSGLLMAKIPVRNYDSESTEPNWLPPVAFYSDTCATFAGQKALVIAHRGSDPRLSVISL
ncbi:uncharacterized protein LOC129590359 [Paramacrobiotus metropolitanus]|uniref:uncharacterized protein LOC129590359 n=1 Tax=Paramacrobiotus metropolitanus TaxID=2943436 RepID=UPI00244613C9|nr:uncharacterized protein LOC129590359 [Paramacrobiotus metropolitanus]